MQQIRRSVKDGLHSKVKIVRGPYATESLSPDGRLLTITLYPTSIMFRRKQTREQLHVDYKLMYQIAAELKVRQLRKEKAAERAKGKMVKAKPVRRGALV